MKEALDIDILRARESVDDGRDEFFAPCCGKIAETCREKPIHQTATLRRDAFAGKRLAKKARMEAGSVNSSPMQLGARQGAALTAQKARANARAALGSEIVKFAVMDDVAIAAISIANAARRPQAHCRGEFGDALTNKADRMLAWFAQPGKLMCPKGTDPRRCAADFASAYCDKTGQTTFVNALQPASDKAGQTAFVNLKEADPREVRELKQIVNGMRQELCAYLANGNGTPRSYWRRLIERTQEEMRIYERTRRELENEKNAAVWEQKNEALRRLGLRTIPNHRDEEM